MHCQRVLCARWGGVALGSLIERYGSRPAGQAVDCTMAVTQSAVALFEHGIMVPFEHVVCVPLAGSLTSVLRAAAGSPAEAATLTWPRRLNMVSCAPRMWQLIHALEVI